MLEFTFLSLRREKKNILNFRRHSLSSQSKDKTTKFQIGTSTMDRVLIIYRPPEKVSKRGP